MARFSSGDDTTGAAGRFREDNLGERLLNESHLVRPGAFRANGDSKTHFVCHCQDFGPLERLGFHDGSTPFSLLPQPPVHPTVYLLPVSPPEENLIATFQKRKDVSQAQLL